MAWRTASKATASLQFARVWLIALPDASPPRTPLRGARHVTVQNKVPPVEARKLLATLDAGFTAGPLIIAGLAAYWYRGGPWELIGCVRFRG